MTRYLPLYRRNMELKEEKRRKQVITLEEEKIVRWAVNDKKDWKREEVEVDYRKIEEIVLQKFLRWKRVFGKVESERMLTRKIWDHAIDLKEIFKPRKGRVYLLSRNKREEVQKFLKNQLRKGLL